MTDCKNCNYTDEYCASGECTSQSPRNGSQKGDLTSQWHKGELKLGKHYYYTTIFSPTVHIQNFTRDVINLKDFKETVAEVLAPVPSYEEWQEKTKSLKVLAEAYCKEKQQNAQLKEQINKYCLDAINRGTANAVKAVKEFGMPERIKELVEQNAQLKELLEWCRDELFEIYSNEVSHPEDVPIIKKLDEVLK